MARNGWVKLFHRLADNSMWLECKFTPGQAWVDLLLMACTMESDQPGAVCCSVLYLANRWKWSHHKVTRFLERLESDGMVFVNRNGNRNGKPNGKLLTVAKYEGYQNGGKPNGKQKSKQNGKENGNIEDDKDDSVRPAEADGTERREVPAKFRDWFSTYEEYEDWRRSNT